ncbi:calcineurin-like phosphoesterase C-terminal domain-containing protein [Mongoliitalea daihaiensis]|uniref:calcineurin-like phosphoesterase C-terminal domain-containing protein n=1 Tax=Mongoliitalea daihaiensis TaxID=2782006 RepID=UPI001F47CEA5|nr:calcineurin-like phosphoesterase C-terminal domain-containing protein [Mongoliitalea daihaiensis]
MIFGDPQPYSLDELEYFRKGIVSEVEGITDVSFGASLGDIVGDRPDFFNAYKEIIEKVGIPWFHVMGNHDMNFDVTSDEFSDESFTAAFGPATYAFNHGNAHYMKQTFFGKEDGFYGSKAHHHFNVGTPSGDWYSGKILANGTPASTMRDGSPKGYVFLEIDGSEYAARYKPAGRAADYQIQVHAPKILVEGVRTTAQLVANFFTGAATDKVIFRINGGEWKPIIIS